MMNWLLVLSSEFGLGLGLLLSLKFLGCGLLIRFRLGLSGELCFRGLNGGDFVLGPLFPARMTTGLSPSHPANLLFLGIGHTISPVGKSTLTLEKPAEAG